MTKVHRSTAELLSDSAVYRRTQRGQRKLLSAEDPGSTPELRILARVNGYTDLRQLVELAPKDALQIGQAIQRLVAQGLIEFVEDVASPPPRRRATFSLA
jgi:hypothetical protein